MRIPPSSPVAPPDPEEAGAVTTISRKAVLGAVLFLTALLVGTIIMTSGESEKETADVELRPEQAERAALGSGEPRFLREPPRSSRRPGRPGLDGQGPGARENLPLPADSLGALRERLRERLEELQRERARAGAGQRVPAAGRAHGPSTGGPVRSGSRYEAALDRRPLTPRGGVSSRGGGHDDPAQAYRAALRSSPLIYHKEGSGFSGGRDPDGGLPGAGNRAGGDWKAAFEAISEIQQGAESRQAAEGEGSQLGPGPERALRPAVKGTLRLEAPLSRYEVKQGTVIPAILETEVNSDVPGGVRARVARDVYDTRTQQHLLIPKGSMLVGAYGSAVAVGQNRLAVAWSRLIFPDGRAIGLGSLETKDARGAGGLRGDVDNHYGTIFTNAILLSLVGAGVGIATYDAGAGYLDRPSPRSVVGGSVASEVGDASREMLRRGMNVRPTVTLEAGQPFNVFVNEDLAFDEPYLPNDGVEVGW